jgi:hypothetical protein
VTAPPTLLLSLDYEPWFSVNDPDEAAVIVPAADAILAAIEAAGARATLFVDVLALDRLHAVGRGAIAARIEAQIAAAVARGHDAQLHLHPHWLGATFDGARWRFPADAYRLDAGCADQGAVAARAESLARQGAAALRRATGNPRHPVVAFRAGGYAIQPNDGAVLAGLARAGIVIDSSVVPGMRKRTARQAVDFAAAPDLPSWRVAPASGVLHPAADGLLEVPIAACRLGPVAGLAQARFHRRPAGVLLGGAGHSRDTADAAVRGSPIERIRRTLAYGLAGFTPLIWPMPPTLLLAATRAWLDRHAGRPGLVFSAMLHPKGFTHTGLSSLQAFLAGLPAGLRLATFVAVARETFPRTAGAC